MEDVFEIQLPVFEGPFDLLLFFIERDELDIHNIPISEITNSFLSYLKQLEKLNMEVASEFILVAATLMRIKAKMLIPRPQLDEEGNEIDPREELERHLIEYKRFKEVTKDLIELEEERQKMQPRGNALEEVKTLAAKLNTELEIQSIDLYKLLNVFNKVMEKYKDRQNQKIHTIRQYPYTLETQRKIILEQISKHKRLTFWEVIEQGRSKLLAIFNFLAILELLQQKQLQLQLGEGFNNFWITQPDA